MRAALRALCWGFRLALAALLGAWGEVAAGAGVPSPGRAPSMLRPILSPQLLSTMARRPRSSRAWRFVLSAARRDADSRAVALAGPTSWGYDSDGQVGRCSR